MYKTVSIKLLEQYCTATLNTFNTPKILNNSYFIYNIIPYIT